MTLVNLLLTAIVDSLIAAGVAAGVVISWQLCEPLARQVARRLTTSAPPPAADPRQAVLAALRDGMPGPMRGGGTSDEARQAHVVTIAEAIRRQLGEVVKKPGLKAIDAVLMIMDGTDLKDAIRQAGTSAPSVRKYRPLVDRVVSSCTLGATLTAAAAIAGPTVAGVVAGSILAAVLPHRSSLSKFSNLRLGREYESDGQVFRVWLATLRCGDTTQECQTAPVLHEPPPTAEEPEERRKREKRENERLVAALSALDPEALAARRAKDRDRKRAKAVQRASQMPALPLADDDPAWLMPPADQPHFVGESVWHFRASEDTPQRATIRQLFRDGSAELATASGAIIRASPQDRLIRVGLPVPSYVGQRVEIDSGSSVRDLAEIAAVHSDGTVDIRPFDSSEGSYSGLHSRVHVEGASAGYLVPRMSVMRDVAMMLADDALVQAGYPTLDELAAEHRIKETNRWRLAPIRWLRRRSGLRRSTVPAAATPDAAAVTIAAPAAVATAADSYIPPKLIHWGAPPGPGRPEWPKPSHRTLLRDPQTPQLQRARQTDWGPLMSKHNLTPTCREDNSSLCCQIRFGHFIATDHPPDARGPHPYIVVPEAEDAGADMRQARELLGLLETACGFGAGGHLLSPPGGTMAPAPTSFEEWKAYIYTATHQVSEQLHSGHPTEDGVCLVRASEANARAIADLQQASVSDEIEPRFLRVSMRRIRARQDRLRQTIIDWPAHRRSTHSTLDKRQNGRGDSEPDTDTGSGDVSFDDSECQSIDSDSECVSY